MEDQPVQNPTPEPTLTPAQVPEPKTRFPVIPVLLVILLLLLGSTAFLYYQNMQLKNMLANYQTPVVSPTPTPTTDPTADWKTYTNEKFGFSFKYPQELNFITDTTDKFVENGINNSMILVQNYDGLKEPGNKPENLQLMILVANTKGEFNMENLSSPITSTINGITLTKGTTTIKMQRVPVVIFNTSPHNVALALNTPDSTQKDLFDQILSTFKFTQ